MSFPYLGEKIELNEEVRGEAGGSFVELPGGLTQFELGGPTNGRLVVLVPGFSVPYFIFDPTFDFLVRSGFRVLRYNLFGRGLSDRPDARYDIHFYTRQLDDLTNALHLEKFFLVGLSMGGPITASYLVEQPGKVEKWILIDPAGVKPIAISPLLQIVKLPLLGELILGLLGTGNMVKSAASDFFDPQLVDHFQAKYRDQMQYKGFKRAILSTLRNGMLDSFASVYHRSAKQKKPTLIFWGRQDSTVPFEHSRDLLRIMPHAILRVVEDCGHIPHYEKPSHVQPAFLDFLRD